MAEAHLVPVLRHLRTLAGVSGTAELSDAQLLERFTRHRDADAFEVLLGRHGPLVWRVCRRVLRQTDLAEDAFQATFLVLAHRAASIRNPHSLASWLHGVAYRTARRARTDLAHHAREWEAHPRSVADPLREAACRELERTIEEEVHRLPERCRLPLLLCYWEGKTNEEAARQLGWPCGTVKTRLAQARQLLHERLLLRGVTLSAGVVVTLLAPAGTHASAPPTLVNATARVVSGLATASSRAAALAQGSHALTTVWTKAGLFLCVVVGIGGMLLARQPGPRTEPEPPPPQQEAKAPTDRLGDPLPPGAVARLGVTRLRHANWVNGVTFTPDGKALVSASWDRTIRFWDPVTGKELSRLRGHTHTVNAVAFTPDGRTLVSAGGDGTVRVWDRATGRELRSFKAHQGSTVNCVAVSPDGKTLATGGGGNGHKTLVLWDLISGAELCSPGGDSYGILSLAFSPDSKTLASGSGKLGRFGAPPGARLPELGGGDVRLWDVPAGKPLRTLAGHTNGVADVAFAPDGKRLVSAGHDSTMRMWDVETGKERLKVEVPSTSPLSRSPSLGGGIDQGGIHAVRFSPDGKTLATAAEDGVVRLWDAETGKETRALPAHGREACAVAYSPDGKTLASSSRDNTIRLWDPATGKQRLPAPGHDGVVNALACSPDGRWVASAGHDRTVRLWDRATARERHVLRGHTDLLASLAFSPDSKWLVSASWDGTVRLWDPARGDEVRRLPHAGPLKAAVFSPDGTTLATLINDRDGQDCTVRLWEPHTGKELRVIKVLPQASGPLQFTHDGKTLATAGSGQVQLIETATGKELRRIEAHWLFTLSPDGKMLLATNAEGLVHLRDVSTGRALHTFGPQEQTRPFVLSPDGRLLVRATKNYEVQLWEAATGQERRRMRGHEEEVTCAGFTPDGRSLLTGSEDGSILVWDMTGGKRSAGEPSAAELRTWLKQLGDEAGRADEAVAVLAASPARAVPFLARYVRPAAVAEPERLKRLIARLDSDQFEERERAAESLEELGELAGPALRAAAAGETSAEVRRHVERLLGKLDTLPSAPVRLREIRAVEVLERAGTPEARRLLERLAGGAPAARLTREAKSALERLSTDQVTPPIRGRAEGVP